MRRATWMLVVGLGLWSPAGAAVPDFELASARVLVTDDASGRVLLAKDATSAAPIASLTKLLTAMVVLDARQPPQQALRITEADIDRLKHTRSGVPVGAELPRATLIELALVGSDNRAASALARHYRAGLDAFRQAVSRKIRALGLKATAIEEPTGLSPNNVASAEDMARVLRAAARYPEIARLSSQPVTSTTVAGRAWEVRNTNAWVGLPGWDVTLSKTGYIREAGSCLGMRLRVGERLVNVVLMGAPSASERAQDVQAIAYWLGGVPLAARSRPAPEASASAPTSVAVRSIETIEAGSDLPASPGTATAIPTEAAVEGASGVAPTPDPPDTPWPVTVISDDESRR